MQLEKNTHLLMKRIPHYIETKHTMIVVKTFFVLDDDKDKSIKAPQKHIAT